MACSSVCSKEFNRKELQNLLSSVLDNLDDGKERVSSWFDLELNRACEWCSSPDFMREEIQRYVEKPLDEWQELLLDLCYCYDCVQEYHRLAEELIKREPHYKKKFQALDIDRLTQAIPKALESLVERKVFDPPLQDVPLNLQVPLMEILRYPYFLHHEQLAALFVQGLIGANKCGHPLKLEEKFPGAYLLLVHPDAEVRGWAVRSTRDLGLINPDDYDLLMEVIKWMLGVVKLDLFENFHLIALESTEVLPFELMPLHLFNSLSLKKYWLGLFVLVRQMDVSTVQLCFMASDDNGHRDFLEKTVLSMKNQVEADDSFWHILQCFLVLLERLGERIWQMPSFNYKPLDIFHTITTNPIYSNSIQQWQDESEASFSQDDFRGSERFRTLSFSSGRFYKTAVALFHPFVQSLLVFDSGGECVSEVVRYLHTVADRCLLHPFRYEVLCSLLRIIHDLLKQRLFSLLVPTVRLWAIDMVAVATCGSVDEKLTDLREISRRLLQHLLKACHRLGFKNALKYFNLINRHGLSAMSEDDRQEVVSLLIQSFETQELQFPVQPAFPAHSRSSSKVTKKDNEEPTKEVLQVNLLTKPTSSLKEIQSQNEQTQRSSTMALWRTGPVKSDVIEAQNEQRKEDTLATNDNQRFQNVNVDGATSLTKGELGREQRKRKIDPTVRSWGKAGPSTRWSSSEDETDEQEYRAKVKRPKKQKRPMGHVRMSKRSLEMNGSPQLRVLLHDYRKGKKSKELLSTKQDAATTRVTSEAKVGAKVHNKVLKTEAKPKRRFRARKSAGQIKKHVPRQQKRGATSEDPIVLSDDGDTSSATEIAERKGPPSNEVINTGIADDYFSDHSKDDGALIEMMDKYDVSGTDSEIQKPTLLNSLRKADVSGDTENSDAELLSSVFEYEATSLSSVSDNLGPKVKTETFESNTDRSSVRPVNSYFKTRFVPNIKTEKIDSHLAIETFESNSTSFSERPVRSSAVKTSILDSCALEVKVEDVTQSDTVLFPEMMDSEPKDHDGNESSGNKEENEGDDVLPNEQVIPESTHRKEDKTLASISKQLEHDAFVDNGMNVWDDYCGYSELFLNSQDNALASIDDDLEELYGTQKLTGEDRRAIFSSRNDTEEADDEPLGQSYNNHLNEAHPSEHTEAISLKAAKRVTFRDDTMFRDDTRPYHAEASSVRPSVSTASKPADEIPKITLTEDEFFHEILGWNVEHLGKSSELPWKLTAVPVPEKTGFDSMDQYYDTFKPLLFMEIWAQGAKDWWDKDVDKKLVSMDVVDGSAPNNLSIIPCSGIISQEQIKRAAFPLESDLVVVRPIVGDVRDGEQMRPVLQRGRDVFGIVEKAEVKPVHSPRRVSIGSSGEDDAGDTPKSQLMLNIKTTSKFRPPRGSCLQVMYVMSLLTALRQWVGLMNIPRSLLAKHILKPLKADYFCFNDYQQSLLVLKEYNESQEKVISTAANAVLQPYPIPRICLVQGPPGTGKSYTTVGLVKEILNRPQELPTQTAAGPQTLPNKCRILLCAPSNAAIDELIGQIVRARIRLDKRQDNKEDRRCHHQSTVKKAFLKNCGDLCLVRVGRKSGMHSSVAKYSLENLAKADQGNESASLVKGNLATIKDGMKECDVKEKELDQKICRLKNSPYPDNQIKLKELHEEKANLKNRKHALQTKYRQEKEKQSNISRQEARTKREILDCADIVCTTLSGAGSTSLKNGLLDGRRSCPFTCVIVDEACQSTELDLLIPLQFKASKLVLVGDPEQLPPTVLSVKAANKLYKRSMFQRLHRFFRHQEMGKPVLMLEEQYRMHPEIAAFPSRHVYSERLKTHSSLENRPFPLTKHYAIFNVHLGQEIAQERGALYNRAEVDLIVDLCSDLTKILRPESVGIITPYRKQKSEIQRSLQNRALSTTSIEVDTVDAFQGREKDVIILSCVRAKNHRGSIGFVGDKQRMNVALTRARHALYVFGHMEALKAASNDWRALIEDAKNRECLHKVESREDVRKTLSIGLQNDYRSPAKDPRFNRNVASASGGDGASTNSKDRPMHQEKTSVNVPPITSTPAVKSVPRNQSPQTVTTEKDSVSVQIAGDTSDREKSVRTKSTDNELQNPLSSDGQGNRKATAYAKTTVHPAHLDERVNRGKDGVYQTNHHRGRGASNSRHRHHPKKTEMRFHSFHSGHGLNDRHHGDRYSSKRPQDSASSSNRPGRETDVSRERHTHHSSNRERHNSGQPNKDRTHEYRHQEKADVSEESAKRRKLQRRDAPHSATITAPTSLGNNTGRREVESPADRSHSPTPATSLWKSEAPASEVFNGEKVDRSSTLYMDTRESSPAESNQSSSTTTALHSNLDSYGDHMDDGDSHMDTQDPAFAAVLANNHSYAPGYFLQLRELTKKSTGSSPSETFASTGSPKSPTETVPDNTLPRRNSTATSQSTSRQPLAMSWPSGSLAPHSASSTGVVRNTSTGFSSFSGQRLGLSSSFNMARPSNQQTSLADSHLSVSLAPHSASPTGVVRNTSIGSSSFSGQRLGLSSSFNMARSSNQHASLAGSDSSLGRRTIRGDIGSDAQEVANIVRQRHPPVQGPQIIDASALFRGRQRTAHAASRDVSSLRERAVGERVERTERSRPRARIDKRKFSENFRGRKSWK